MKKHFLRRPSFTCIAHLGRFSAHPWRASIAHLSSPYSQLLQYSLPAIRITPTHYAAPHVWSPFIAGPLPPWSPPPPLTRPAMTLLWPLVPGAATTSRILRRSPWASPTWHPLSCQLGALRATPPRRALQWVQHSVARDADHFVTWAKRHSRGHSSTVASSRAEF